jgi:PAS domain S-box-containing protein
MLWIILLAVATCLTIALRRVLRRQKPLNYELYAKTVAVDHVRSGVAWVRADGTFGSVNQAFAKVFDRAPKSLVGQEWYEAFNKDDHARLRQAYGDALLMGITTVDTDGVRVDGSRLRMHVRLVVVHDPRLRFVGLLCMLDDRTRECELEDRIREVEGALLAITAPKVTGTPQPEVDDADALRFTPRSGPVSAATVARRAIQRLGLPVAAIG